VKAALDRTGFEGMGAGITSVDKGTLQTGPACIGRASRDPVGLDWLLETREEADKAADKCQCGGKSEFHVRESEAPARC
jgi:hypothetical protein